MLQPLILHAPTTPCCRGRVADAVQAARLGAGPPQVPQGGASGGRPRRYRDILNDFASWQQARCSQDDVKSMGAGCLAARMAGALLPHT